MDATVISKLAIDLDLREADILEFLTIICTHPDIELKELLHLAGLPETQLKRLLKSFSTLFESSTQKVVVKTTELGKLEAFLNSIDFKVIDESDEEKIIKILKEVSERRGPAKRQYDQFFANLDTVIDRALLLKKQGNLYKRKLLFLGDDDLTSIAAAVIAQDCQFLVLDIDEELLKLINEINQKYSLRINTQLFDLRNAPTQEMRNQFDLVFTDPPYTPQGVSLFLNQAITFLKKSLVSQIYLCFGTSARAKEREVVIQKIINERGLVIDEKIPGFNKYFGAESIGSTSSLYILTYTPQSKIIKDGIDRLYTHE